MNDAVPFHCCPEEIFFSEVFRFILGNKSSCKRLSSVRSCVSVVVVCIGGEYWWRVLVACIGQHT